MRGTQATPARRHPAPVHWLTMPDGRDVGYQIDPELVEDFMLRAGVTRADLARRIGSSKGYVTDILGGRRQPRENVVKAIADALDVNPRALLLRAVAANSVSETSEVGSVSA